MKLPAPLAGPLLILSMVAMLLTLPMTLPIAILLITLDRRRLRNAACALRYVRCGHELGASALDAVAAASKAAMEGRHKQRTFHGFLRLASRPDARRIGCDLFYRWNAHLRKFEVEPDMSIS